MLFYSHPFTVYLGNSFQMDPLPTLFPSLSLSPTLLLSLSPFLSQNTHILCNFPDLTSNLSILSSAKSNFFSSYNYLILITMFSCFYAYYLFLFQICLLFMLLIIPINFVVFYCFCSLFLTQLLYRLLQIVSLSQLSYCPLTLLHDKFSLCTL